MRDGCLCIRPFQVLKSIIIADILYYFAEIIHIAGIFAFLYPLTDFITENPAVIFVSREGEEASGIREHADAYRQQA